MGVEARVSRIPQLSGCSLSALCVCLSAARSDAVMRYGGTLLFVRISSNRGMGKDFMLLLWVCTPTEKCVGESTT